MEVQDEEERISIVQNGLLPGLRSRAMSRDWRSVQEMSIWLRKTEMADQLYGQQTQQPFVRNFFTKRPTMAVSMAHEMQDSGGEYECDETNDLIELEESPCNVVDTRRNFERKPQTNRFENKQKKGCYNCKSSQHYMNDCDQPISRIFCFRCGKDGSVAPTCECRKNRV